MSGVKIGRLSWIFPRGPNAITRVPRRGSLKSGLEKCSVRRDLANMAESKDENTGPEDMGNEWEVLRGKERDAPGERVWNVALPGRVQPVKAPFPG